MRVHPAKVQPIMSYLFQVSKIQSETIPLYLLNNEASIEEIEAG